MSRGADVQNWKGVQLTDDPLLLSWYCDKAICQQTLHVAIRNRTRELRVRAGLSPDPPPKGTKMKKSLPDTFRQQGNVFAPPPGGFGEEKQEHVEEEEEADERRSSRR